MNEDTFNMEVRKFLKVVGVTSQREIELAVRKAIDTGRLKRQIHARRQGRAYHPEHRARASHRRQDRDRVSQPSA
jgi:hypothetical protein